ncbi:MAG: hypothetical protein ACK4YP_21730, partial [Myxococcota bacterium]
MDVFLGVVCSGLALVLVYALPIVALVSNVRLRRTIEALQRRIEELEARPSAAVGASASGGGALPHNAPPGGGGTPESQKRLSQQPGN